MVPNTDKHERSPWPHRWATALCCATFPLVWVGGLVTTTDAGMAVPDWPNTYGYNLFLYPWQTWLSGPWDLFIEHGHRLLGAVAGLLTIGLLVVLWRTEDRRWVRWLGVVALALIVSQGVLGGLRVLFDERVLAMIHGFTGPLFFALVAALVVVTSQSWRDAIAEPATAPGRFVRRLVVVTCILFYLQIVLGAVLRHVPVSTEPATFRLAVQFHLLMAVMLVLHVVMVLWYVLRYIGHLRPLHRLAMALGGLMAVQVVLGAVTWVAMYSTPFWFDSWIGPVGYTIHADGWLQAHIVTAHAAIGSLLLAGSLAIALYTLRLIAAPQAAAPTTLRTQGVAV